MTGARARLALALLGAWTAATIGVWLLASGNLRAVDRVLAPDHRPPPGGPAGRPAAPTEAEGQLLRSFAAELNRELFRGWARVQLGVAAAVCLLLLPLPGISVGPKVTAALAALVAGVLALGLGPQMADLGARLDLLPRPVPPELLDHRRFMRLHGIYMLLDLLKLGLIASALVLLVRRRERPAHADYGPGGRAPVGGAGRGEH